VMLQWLGGGGGGGEGKRRTVETNMWTLSTRLVRRQSCAAAGEEMDWRRRGPEMKLSVAMKKFGSARWVRHVISQINGGKRGDRLRVR
jgi:hypothetical protein